MPLDPYDAETTIKQYLLEIDNSFETLTEKYEGRIVDLPSMVFASRRIQIFKLGSTAPQYYLVTIVIDNNLDSDVAYFGQLNSNEEIKQATSPVEFDFDLNNITDEYGMVVSDIQVIKTSSIDAINALPIVDGATVAIVREDLFFITFSPQQAKEYSLNKWNNLDNQLNNKYSFVNNLNVIFVKFANIIKRKSFLERRIHRFINAHRQYILPSFKKCYFEHSLVNEDEVEVCRADFILERETGFPPLLIELENPIHPVFTKRKDLTWQTNHAIKQITDWIRIIKSVSRNVEGEMEFLSNLKMDQLVIIGRGLDNIEEMKNTKFSNALIWTYDLLILEAKRRWNELIIDQCRSIGLDNPNLL